MSHYCKQSNCCPRPDRLSVFLLKFHNLYALSRVSQREFISVQLCKSLSLKLTRRANTIRYRPYTVMCSSMLSGLILPMRALKSLSNISVAFISTPSNIFWLLVGGYGGARLSGLLPPCSAITIHFHISLRIVTVHSYSTIVRILTYFIFLLYFMHIRISLELQWRTSGVRFFNTQNE